MDYFSGYKKIILFFFILAIILVGIVTATWQIPKRALVAAILRVVNISATVPVTSKSATFNPLQGGTTVMPHQDGGMVAFSFPPNFSNVTANIQLKAQAFPNTFFDADKPAPLGKAFVGKTYNFDLYNLSSGAQMAGVAKPISITIQYTQADVAGIDEGTLAPYRRETEDTEWQLIPGALVDTTTHSITFFTTQFSSFALLAAPSVTTAIANSTGAGAGAFYYLTSVLQKVIPGLPSMGPIAVAPVITKENITQKPLVASILLTKNLYSGVVDKEVALLQKYLNAHGFLVAVKGQGSLGFETNTFGALTYKALIKFQEAHAADILAPNFKKGTGTLGPKTRNYINSHR